MVDEFKKLKLDFEGTQARFRKAKTLEEKQELSAISWKIIGEAKDRIAEFKAQASAVGPRRK